MGLRCAIALLVGCAAKVPAPSTAAKPGKRGIEVLHKDADGHDRIARRQLGDDACAWELLVAGGRSGKDWLTLPTLPGLPHIAPGPTGELVVWTTCEGPHLSGFFIADGADLSSQLPEFVEDVRWTSDYAVRVVGRSPGDRLPTALVFARGEDQWIPVNNTCVSLRITAEGGATRDGTDVSLLLFDDLNDDDVPEWVVGEPDLCGTGSCDATVYTPCTVEDLARPIGRLDHTDGVSAGAETQQGWRALHSRAGESTTTYQFSNGEYRRH